MQRVGGAALLLCLTVWPGLGLAQEVLPPPPPPPPLVHGVVWFDPGSIEPLRTGRFDPVSYLAPRLADPEIDLIWIVGQTDRTGASDYNMDLSERRARRIAELLVVGGAQPDKIVIRACGEARLNKPTPDGVAEPLNRVAYFDWGYRNPDAPSQSRDLLPDPNCRTSRYLAGD